MAIVADMSENRIDLATADSGTGERSADAGRSHLRFVRRMIAMFALLGLVMAVIAVQVYRTVGDLTEENALVAHTYEVQQSIGNAVAALRDAEAAQRAYMLGSNAARLADYYQALPHVAEHGTRLRALVADNPAQGASARELDALLDQRIAMMNDAFVVHQKGGLEAVRADPRFTKTRDQDAAIDTLAAQMQAREEGLLKERQSSSARKADLTRLLTVGAIVVCLIVLALALWFILREQRRRMASERRVIASYADLAHSLEASRRLGDTLRQLSDLGEMLQGCRNIDEAATGLRTALAGLFPRTSGSINLINASQNVVAPIGIWGAPVAGEAVYAPDDCWALRRGRMHPEEGAVTAFVCKHFDAEGADAQAHLCVPLLAQGSMLGTLVLDTGSAVGREVRDAAIAAAEQISLAIANLKLQETLRTQSLRDPLTGLFNRRYLEVSIERDLARAIRRSQPLAVLMIDVDHFKRFNDDHGHDAGDTLLGAFGQMLSALVRNEDVACRYGGEEFTVVMQETDAALALDRAEEICRATREMDVRHRQQSLGAVSVSIGIASYPQHGDSVDQLLQRADRALYAAKRSGRDRVCVADR